MEQQLPLTNAYATWVLGEHNDQWVVRDKDGKEIGRFPSHWKEKDCMVAIRLGRKFEKIAYSLGEVAGSDKQKNFYKGVLKQTDSHIRELEAQNERLSDKLEKMIIGEEE